MATDQVVAGIARRSATRMAATWGPRVPGDVEAALAEAAARPGQYVDPVSIGGLIVAAASFAWQVYRDTKGRGGTPSNDVIARGVRVRLRESDHAPGPDDEQVIEVVVEETLKQDDD
jgi:hypothetical protein